VCCPFLADNMQINCMLGAALKLKEQGRQG